MIGCANLVPPVGKRELMILANDEKRSWHADGKVVLGAPGSAIVSIIDIGTDPLALKIIVNYSAASER